MSDFRIEAGYKNARDDAISHAVLADIKEDLLIKGVKALNYVDVYILQGEFSDDEVRKVAQKLMHDPITQKFSVDAPLFPNFDWEIEVRVHKNLTDNVGIAARIGIEDLLGRELRWNESVRSARKYVLHGKLSEKEANQICTGLLGNAMVEEWEIKRGKGQAAKGGKGGKK
ncbi:hypothetical protein KKH30_05160 [Candidatus Micrarchaeota archaeon]|nr:hypothetical protein [Candidatus Micrarchaeota archaeon]